MRTHKITIRISFYLSIISLVLLIVFACNPILLSIFTGIFASSLLSLLISSSNYIVLKKNKAELIVVLSYKMNTESYANLYSQSKNLTLEEYQKVLQVLTNTLFDIYVENHELLIGLFWHNKVKTDIYELEKLIEKRLKKVGSIEYYIEFFENDAVNHTKQIYEDLDKLIDDNEIYLKAIGNNKKCKGEFSSLETHDKDDAMKKRLGEKYRSTLR